MFNTASNTYRKQTSATYAVKASFIPLTVNGLFSSKRFSCHVSHSKKKTDFRWGGGDEAVEITVREKKHSVKFQKQLVCKLKHNLKKFTLIQAQYAHDTVAVTCFPIQAPLPVELLPICNCFGWLSSKESLLCRVWMKLIERNAFIFPEFINSHVDGATFSWLSKKFNRVIPRDFSTIGHLLKQHLCMYV